MSGCACTFEDQVDCFYSKCPVRPWKEVVRGFKIYPRISSLGRTRHASA